MAKSPVFSSKVYTDQPPAAGSGLTTTFAGRLLRTACVCARRMPVRVFSAALRICELPMKSAYIGPASMMRNAKIASAIRSSIRVNPRAVVVSRALPLATRTILARHPAIGGAAHSPMGCGRPLHIQFVDGVRKISHAFAGNSGRLHRVLGSRRRCRTGENESIIRGWGYPNDPGRRVHTSTHVGASIQKPLLEMHSGVG